MNKILPLVFLFSCVLFSSFVEAQKPSFAFTVGNPLYQQATDIAVDASGNSIVVGLFQGANIDFDPSPQNEVFLSSSGDNDVFVAKYNASGQYQWAFRIGGTGNDGALDVALDASGNIYLSGYFRGSSVDFDPSGSSQALLSSHGDNGTDPGFGGDAFLAKYNTNGQYQWAFNVGSSSILDFGNDIYVDKNGDLLWTGAFAGTNVDFDPSPFTNSLSAQGVMEIFLAKYNSNGQYLWAKSFGGSTVSSSSGRGITSDNNGNIYLTGIFDGTIDLDPSPSVSSASSNGCLDFFLVKLNSSGQYTWGFSAGGADCDYTWDIGIDASNNVYLAGEFQSANADFNPGPATNSMGSAGGYDVFVAKYDQNGNYVFSQSFGSPGDDIAYRLVVQPSGYTITGGFSGTVDFNYGAGVANLSSAGGSDIFLAKYSLSGQFQNGFRIGSAANEAALGLVSSDIDSKTYIAGFLQSTNADFDPSSASLNVSSQGGNDIFVAQYNYSQVLPLQLTDLNAKLSGNDGMVTWQTESEEKMAAFEVERSSNGRDFVSIGREVATGYSSVPKRYAYNDKNITVLGVSAVYYRLKMIDSDGHFVYSNTVPVNISNRKAIVSLYPNPVREKATLQIASLQNEAIRCTVVDAAGRTVLTQAMNVAKGNNTLSIDTRSFSPGIYTVQLNGEQTTTAIKLLKR